MEQLGTDLDSQAMGEKGPVSIVLIISCILAF